MSTTSPSQQPIFLSPTLPSELLSYILQHHHHPTVLVICSTRHDFLSALTQDILQQISHLAGHGTGGLTSHSLPAHELLVAPLAQVAISRHIRLIFVPTVTHLQAWFSVFDPRDSTIPPPPAREEGQQTATTAIRPPLLLTYGFLTLHRETSEWSAQGICNTAAALIEAAHRTGFRATVVEPLVFDDAEGRVRDLEGLLTESIPVLSGAARREIDEGRWTGRTVTIERILRRWFEVQDGEWDVCRAEVIPLSTQTEEMVQIPAADEKEGHRDGGGGNRDGGNDGQDDTVEDQLQEDVAEHDRSGCSSEGGYGCNGPDDTRAAGEEDAYMQDYGNNEDGFR